MDKKPTWYELNSMEVMDVMRKGRNAKASDYQTLDKDTVDKLNDKLETVIKPELRKNFEKELGPLSEEKFNEIFEKTLNEVEKGYDIQSFIDGPKKEPNWYELNRAGQEIKLEQAIRTGDFKENGLLKKDEMKEWNELKLTAEQARGAEKRLQGVLETAIKNGADKEVTSKIFDAWKVQNEKAEKFEEALYKKGKPDIMQSFASKQKENVQKGMYLLGDKVDGLNKDVSTGKIQSKGLFMQKIGEVNLEVTSMYTKAEQEIYDKLRDAFGTKDISSFQKINPERLDGWVKAMDVAETYTNKALEIDSLLNKQRLGEIEKVLNNANSQKKEVMDAYKKEIEALKEKIDYKADLINSGYKGGLGKDLEVIKLSAEAEKTLNNAKTDLKAKMAEIDLTTLNKVNKINDTAYKLANINASTVGINKTLLKLTSAVKAIVRAPFKMAKRAINKIGEKSMSILSGSSKKAPEMAKDTVKQEEKQR